MDAEADRGTVAVEHIDCTLWWSHLCGAVSWIRGQEGHLKGQVALGIRSWWAVGCSEVRKTHARDQLQRFAYIKIPAR